MYIYIEKIGKISPSPHYFSKWDKQPQKQPTRAFSLSLFVFSNFIHYLLRIFLLSIW